MNLKARTRFSPCTVREITELPPLPCRGKRRQQLHGIYSLSSSSTQDAPASGSRNTSLGISRRQSYPMTSWLRIHAAATCPVPDSTAICRGQSPVPHSPRLESRLPSHCHAARVLGPRLHTYSVPSLSRHAPPGQLETAVMPLAGSAAFFSPSVPNMLTVPFSSFTQARLPSSSIRTWRGPLP